MFPVQEALGGSWNSRNGITISGWGAGRGQASPHVEELLRKGSWLCRNGARALRSGAETGWKGGVAGELAAWKKGLWGAWGLCGVAEDGLACRADPSQTHFWGLMMDGPRSNPSSTTSHFWDFGQVFVKFASSLFCFGVSTDLRHVLGTDHVTHVPETGPDTQ